MIVPAAGDLQPLQNDPVASTRPVPGKWRATALYAALTLLLMYPISVHPASLVAGDGPDTHLGLFVLSWDVHAFTTQPLAIFDANTFYPNPRTLAYQDNLIGSAFIAAPILWLTGNPVLALNVICLLATVLCGLGAYVLARRLGLGTTAALLCGLIFAFGPPRFFRYSQVGLAPLQWIPFTLASLQAYLDGGARRDLRLAAAFFTLQTLTSSHGAVFLTLAVLLTLGYRALLGEPLRVLARVRDLGLTGVLLVVPAVLSYLPYRLNQIEFGLRRGLDDWERAYESFIASPTHVHVWLLSAFGLSYINDVAWGFLFPGYVPVLLAAVATGGALAAGVRFRRRWHVWPGRHTASEVVLGLAVACALLSTLASILRRPDGLDAATRFTTLVPWLVCAVIAVAAFGMRGERVWQRPARYARPLRLLAAALAIWTLVAGARALVPAGDGLTAQYYDNGRWADPPLVATVDPRASTAILASHWRDRPPEVFTVRWTGYLTVGATDHYRFALTSDDGARLWVGDRLVIDNAEATRPTAETGVDLERGSHRVVLEYAQRGGDYSLEWAWAEGNDGFAPVPAWRLSQRRARPSAAVAARTLGLAARACALAVVCGALWLIALILPARWQAWGDLTQSARRAPTALYLVLTLVCMALAMGPPHGIWQYVYTWPGFSFIRAPLRFMVLGALGIAVLAAVGFERLAAMLRPNDRRILAAVLGALMIVEFNGAPIFAVPFTVRLPAADRWIAAHAVPSVVAEVPIGPERYQTTYMLHSTAHWQRTVAGYGGIRPALNEIVNGELRSFPDERSVQRLRAIGVTHVIVHVDLYAPADWPPVEARLRAFENRGLVLEYADPSARVYSLGPPSTHAE